MAPVRFQKAERGRIRIKISIQGPSGSGKTRGALAIATTLAKFRNSRIAFIDTENGSASSYSDDFDFDVLELGPPFTSTRYIEAMKAAIDAGYNVLVIDSLSHQWAGEGGILNRKEQMDARPGANSWQNWATFTSEHVRFIGTLLHLQADVISCLRTKQEWTVQEDNGKKRPVKLGLAAVQREGLEFEFFTAFDVQMDHRATASKDRTGLFMMEGQNQIFDLVKGGVGDALVNWLTTAKEEPMATPDQVERVLAKLEAAKIPDKQRTKIQERVTRGLTEVQADDLLTWFEEKAEEGKSGTKEPNGDTEPENGGTNGPPSETNGAPRETTSARQAPPPQAGGTPSANPGERDAFAPAVAPAAVVEVPPGGDHLATPDDLEQIRALGFGLPGMWKAAIEARLTKPLAFSDAQLFFDILSDPGEVQFDRLRVVLGPHAPPSRPGSMPKGGPVSGALKATEGNRAGVK